MQVVPFPFGGHFVPLPSPFRETSPLQIEFSFWLKEKHDMSSTSQNQNQNYVPSPFAQSLPPVVPSPSGFVKRTTLTPDDIKHLIVTRIGDGTILHLPSDYSLAPLTVSIAFNIVTISSPGLDKLEYPLDLRFDPRTLTYKRQLSKLTFSCIPFVSIIVVPEIDPLQYLSTPNKMFTFNGPHPQSPKIKKTRSRITMS